MIVTLPLLVTQAWMELGSCGAADALGATTAAAKAPTATNHVENRSCRITRLLSPEDACDEAALASKEGRLTASRGDCKQYFATLTSGQFVNKSQRTLS